MSRINSNSFLASFLDGSNSILSDEHIDGGMYGDSRIDRGMKMHMGTLVVPIAGPIGTDPKIVRTHAPYQTKKTVFTAQRAGEKPTSPHWDTGDENDVPIFLSFVPYSPLPIDNRTAGWRFDGVYTYVSAIVPDLQNPSFVAGVSAAVKGTPEETAFTISNFSRDLIRDTSSRRRRNS